ncbi:acyltransferase [Sphingomonas sp. XMGL2]|uniref:Acyltransferase n=1 Tax=Sphingomonas quercus TaxID=2842451 RepID=A0ABS6BDZ1_9SPHN|nr:acyltransferase [Sphingomonas quercus]MBU3076529.1 acyltransferase [Sphingomonas quercus]
MTSAEGFQPRRPDPGRRIYGIDAWRGLVLALLGIALHGTVALASPQAKYVIKEGIHVFRMETFFAISGFLACLKNDRPGWVRQRAVTLLVPLAFVGVSTIIVRNLFTNPPHWWAETDHLWFLPALMLCSLLPPMTPSARQVVAFALPLSLGLVVLTALPPDRLPLLVSNLAATPYYAVFYLAGHAIAAGSITPRRSHMWLAIAAYTGWVGWVVLSSSHSSFLPASPRSVGGAIGQLARCAVALSVTLGIFYQALRVRRTGWPMPQLSRAAYTIYLVHFVVLAIMQMAAYRLNPDYRGWPAYFAFCAVTLIVCLTAHYGLVERFGAIAFLLNGRRLTRHRPPAPVGGRRPVLEGQAQSCDDRVTGMARVGEWRGDCPPPADIRADIVERDADRPARPAAADPPVPIAASRTQASRATGIVRIAAGMAGRRGKGEGRADHGDARACAEAEIVAADRRLIGRVAGGEVELRRADQPPALRADFHVIEGLAAAREDMSRHPAIDAQAAEAAPIAAAHIDDGIRPAVAHAVAGRDGARIEAQIAQPEPDHGRGRRPPAAPAQPAAALVGGDAGGE